MGWGIAPRHLTIELYDGNCSLLLFCLKFFLHHRGIFSQLQTLIFTTLPQQIYRLERLSGNQLTSLNYLILNWETLMMYAAEHLVTLTAEDMMI